MLRKSGLTYTIIRVEGFNNLPGGIQAIEIKQVRTANKVASFVTSAFCCFIPALQKQRFALESTRVSSVGTLGFDGPRSTG